MSTNEYEKTKPLLRKKIMKELEMRKQKIFTDIFWNIKADCNE